MGGMRWRAEVGPIRVLELRYLAHALERLIVVRECELAHSNVRLLGCRRCGGGVILRIREKRRPWLRRRRLPLPDRGSVRVRTLLVALDLGWLQGSTVLPELLQMQVAEVLLRPIVVCLDLSALLLGGKHDNDADVLLPDNIPEILG